jgi:hypothetical protein
MNSKINKRTGLEMLYPSLSAFRVNSMGLELVSRLELDGIQNFTSVQMVQRLKTEDIFVSLTGSQLVLTKFEKSTFSKMRFVDLGEGLAPYFSFFEFEQ